VHGVRQLQFAVEGRPAPSASDEARAGDILISSDYFHAMGIPLREGRAFTENDDQAAPPVVIVSQTLARRYFSNENPLGRRLSIKEPSPMIC
jgi:putative ABC transport system permease protein